jgi:hypothetical protein
MIKTIIERLNFQPVQTLGHVRVIEKAKDPSLIPQWKPIFECESLERPWLNNFPFISCIPAGTYMIKKRWSPRFKSHLHVLSLTGKNNIEGRTWILIHAGNYFKNTKGCILVGAEFQEINSDGWLDITSSKETLKALLSFLPNQSGLEIRDIGAKPLSWSGTDPVNWT